MDRAVLYKALLARDKRFDGRFYVGVRTTGIYCRPVCPARPLLKNVGFYRSAAEAESAGFRPCLRCRPDLSPAAPLFQGTAAVVQRALRLIGEGAADEASLETLADRLGLTDRHLRRLFAEHVGASPVEVAASRRLHLARMLLSQTALPVTEIAFASGFRSLRRFNQSFRDRYDRAPREFRRTGGPAEPGIRLELPVLEPYDWRGLSAFLGAHATPGVERFEGNRYERLLDGGGRLTVSHRPGALLVTLEGCEPRGLRDPIERVRHLFDAEHNPALLPKRLRGLRVPGAFDGFETAVGIILGQLVSTESARASAKRLVETHGEPCRSPGPGLTRHFPSPRALAGADLPFLPRGKAKAIRSLAKEVSAGRLRLARSAPLEETRARLLALPGIGPWTTELIALRCLADPDAFPEGDLAVAQALQTGLVQPDGWRPWRGYLTLWLWKRYRKEKK